MLLRFEKIEERLSDLLGCHVRNGPFPGPNQGARLATRQRSCQWKFRPFTRRGGAMKREGGRRNGMQGHRRRPGPLRIDRPNNLFGVTFTKLRISVSQQARHKTIKFTESSPVLLNANFMSFGVSFGVSSDLPPEVYIGSVICMLCITCRNVSPTSAACKVNSIAQAVAEVDIKFVVN